MKRIQAATTLLALLGGGACSKSSGGLNPSNLPRLGAVDERYQSFNVEMIEVTGGRFWKPYKDIAPPSSKNTGATPAGMDPGLYEQRPPTDLANPRLRKLAAALAPAYVRVSGTWANTTYFHDSDAPPPASPPKGFSGVLTRQQWKGVIDFAHAADAKLVSSFATSPGTRDAHGVWTPKEARKVLSYTKSVGGAIAAAEFMNEPTAAAMGGAPKGYDAAAYGRDLAVFRPFIKEAAPDLTILGPGSVGEGTVMSDSMSSRMPSIKSEDLLAAAGPVFDAFSYHFYGAVSNRCAALGAGATTTADAALSQEWLARTDRAEQFYQALRDRFEPGKPLWITETADAACGGNPWASTFLDSFRYLDQLGRLAKRGVQVIAHNTLAASDYGLLDEPPSSRGRTTGRRCYGGSSWRPTVLDAGAPGAPALHVYAHCLRGVPGGVAMLVINTDRAAAQDLELATATDRYTLTAPKLEGATVQLNGTELKLGADDAIPPFTAAPLLPGA